MLLTPGPVEIPSAARKALTQPVLHHRSDAFEAHWANTQRLLRRAFGGFEREVLLLTSSGSGALAATAENLFREGDRVVALVGGKFGRRFADYARAQGAAVTTVAHDPRLPLDIGALFAEVTKETRALLVTATETASGACVNLEAVAAAAEAYPDLLLVVDGIAWLGAEEHPTSLARIDVMLGASQKAFAGLTGLAFVQLSQRAEAALTEAAGYFDLRAIARAQAKGGVAYSTPSPLVLALEASLEWLFAHATSPAALHAERAKAFRRACAAHSLALLPVEPGNALSVVELPDAVDADQVRAQLERQTPFECAAGQDEWAGKILRIGHMGDLPEHVWPDLAAAIAAAL